MLRTTILCLAAWSLAFCTLAASAADGKDDSKFDNKNLGKIRHVVLFAWKEGTPPAKIKEIEDAFRGLPERIPEIVGFEWGTNNSPEGLDNDFTHCFFVTFDDAKGRAVYLPHPAHKAFVDLIRPHMEKVLVIDYVAQE